MRGTIPMTAVKFRRPARSRIGFWARLRKALKALFAGE